MFFPAESSVLSPKYHGFPFLVYMNGKHILWKICHLHFVSLERRTYRPPRRPCRAFGPTVLQEYNATSLFSAIENG